MIIIIGNSKGGEGKSTIATNLAAMMVNRGNDVLLVDADPQRSSYQWAQTRNYLIDTSKEDIKPITAVCLSGAIRPEIEMQAKKYDYVIIDTQGRKCIELVSASIIADIIIMPVTIGIFSAWALDDMDGILENCKATGNDVSVLAVVNRASTNSRVDDRQEFVDAIAEMKEGGKLTNLSPIVLDATLGHRTIYRTAASYGLSVEEMPGNSKKERQIKEKAVEEMSNLYSEVFQNG